MVAWNFIGTKLIMKARRGSVSIESFKFDGSFHYTYQGCMMETREDNTLGKYWECLIEKNSPIKSYRGEFPARTKTRAYFFEDQWFNLLIPSEPIGKRKMIAYANISTPAYVQCHKELSSERLIWIDLDLDLIVLEDFFALVDDEDEFLEHIGLMNYPNWLVSKARIGLARAVELYESREFPFSDLS